MKTFNIVKQDTIILGRHLPINACYGCYVVSYKKYCGHTFEPDADKRFRKKPIYKTTTEKIYYYITDFSPLKNYYERNHLYYNVYVYNPKTDSWHKTDTRKDLRLEKLGDFLAKMFEKNNIKSTTKVIPWIDYKVGNPKEKKAQVYSDSPYEPNVGYVLSKNVMTCHNINRDGWNSYDKPRRRGEYL